MLRQTDYIENSGLLCEYFNSFFEIMIVYNSCSHQLSFCLESNSIDYLKKPWFTTTADPCALQELAACLRSKMTHSYEMKWLHRPLKGLISLSNSVKVGGTSAWKINTYLWKSDVVQLISVLMACFSFLELNVRLSKDGSRHQNCLKCCCTVTHDSWEKCTVNQTLCAMSLW